MNGKNILRKACTILKMKTQKDDQMDIMSQSSKRTSKPIYRAPLVKPPRGPQKKLKMVTGTAVTYF